MRKKRLYLAYGSNLSEEQMAVRCPDAKIVGKAMLKDWKLCFKIHADIEPCDGGAVPVLVWEISEKDEAALDRYEGYPGYYTKTDITVNMTGLRGKRSRSVTAMAYTMTEGHSLRMPMKGYYDILDEGYERFSFDKSILRQALIEAKEAMEHEFS